MTITTTRSREHNVASGLTELASMFFADLIPEISHPDIAWKLEIPTSSALEVRDFADRMGVPFDSHTGLDGHVYTTADLLLGAGAVNLHVVHVAFTEAV